MSTKSIILHELSTIGVVVDIRSDASNPSYVIEQFPNPDGARPSRCYVTFHKSKSGVDQVEFRIASGYMFGFVDHEILDQNIHAINVSLQYGVLSVGGNHMTEEFEFKVFAKLTLELTELEGSEFSSAIEAFIAAWQAGVEVANNEIIRNPRNRETIDGVETILFKPQTLSEDDMHECDAVVQKAIDHAAWREGREARLAEYRKQKEAKIRRERIEQSISKLEKLVGLSPVKTLVRQLVAQQEINTKRIEVGLKPVLLSPHLVFTGNPGTGKTTVAKLIGEIYQCIGLLEKGHVVETDRSGLVGGYVGHTALKTKAICVKALGGVLFIDEAYSLAVDHRDYGYEAIEALLTFMEENRGKFAVVVAGYPDRMEKFLASNPGLRSRFDLTIPFGDYCDEEMLEIFERLLAQNDFDITDTALEEVKRAITAFPRTETFANAREVRRLFNAIVAEQALQLAHIPQPTVHQLRLITSFCIPASLVPQHEISLAELPPFK